MKDISNQIHARRRFLRMLAVSPLIAVARAARAKDHLQILAAAATSSVEEVTAARGTPVWQQLYPTNVWELGRSLVKRAEAAGCPAIVFTVDQQEGANRETLFRAQRADKRDCTACHKSAYTGYARGRPGGATTKVIKLAKVGWLAAYDLKRRTRCPTA
jgi:hypothetical protein